MNYYVDKRIRPAFNYYGGKSMLCHKILQMAPSHTTYVECFAGGLNVLLNKYRSDVEVVCDVSTELIKFYQVLVERCEELIERVRVTKFDKMTFLAALAAGDKGCDLTRAINFLCRQRMSFSGRGVGWAEPATKVDAWETLPHDLRIVAERLRGVKILVRSALELITEYDSPDTFFYCDPPYYSATRVNPNAYVHEMSEMDHLRLLRLLNMVSGNVILSGYDHPMYNKELAGWDRVEIEMPTGGALRRGEGTRTQRTEVLWVKPQPSVF